MTRTDVDPVQRALLLKRYRNLYDRLTKESTVPGEDVFVTAQDPELSRLQSRVAELASQGEPLGPGGEEVKFGTGFEGRDWYGWLKSTIDWVDRVDAHPFLWSTAPATVIGNSFRMAMVGDWGTGLYGAPVIAKNIAETAPYDLLLHLGDVYYSGTPQETKERFLQFWPFSAAPMSRALNGNHEMYSGGNGYFDMILPRFRQPASYFALQNSNWILAGLDTAYVDHDMVPEQVTWLEQLVANRGQRKVVLFSHQQLFSRLDKQGDRLKPKLDTLLTGKKITAWYWGHEHQCIVYDQHPTWGLVARCLGNGGIPEPRNRNVRNAKIEKTAGSVTWRCLEIDPQKPWAPRALVLDGCNPYVTGREDDFGPHGYMTLHFDGPTLKERVFLPDGTKIFENTIN
jgi:Calcineurin-like phosphoesterase